MSDTFYEGEVFRVTFPDGNWVDVTEELTQADQDFLLNEMAKVEDKRSNSVAFNLGKSLLLERCIKAWSFDKPINPENISHLRLKYRSKVLREIDRLNAQANSWLVKN